MIEAGVCSLQRLAIIHVHSLKVVSPATSFCVALSEGRTLRCKSKSAIKIRLSSVTGDKSNNKRDIVATSSARLIAH